MARRRVFKPRFIIGLLGFVIVVSVVHWHRRADSDSVVSSPIRDVDYQVRVPSTNRQFKVDALNAHTVHKEQAVNNIGDVDDVYKKRLLTAKRYCNDISRNDTRLDAIPSGRVWSYTDQNTSLHYCAVPKVGCTTWISIFRFLNNDFLKGTHPTRPSDIDRFFVHYGYVNDTQEMSFESFKAKRKHAGGDMFMFTRDPYSRLWSAYVDKFFLPDFWQTKAVEVMKLIRKPSSEIPAHQRCFNNITFEEFLKFVVAKQKSPDPHWIPVHRLCSPCHANFDFIGKQETFFKDYKYILKKHSRAFLIEQDAFEARAKHETELLINYNLFLKKFFEDKIGCFKPLDVARRLWKVFQYNGYVHTDTKFPENSMDMDRFKTNPTTALSKLVRQAIDDQSRRGITLGGQKRAKMVEAYKGIPRDLLKEVQKVYLHDFGLFGYNKEPSDIFQR